MSKPHDDCTRGRGRGRGIGRSRGLWRAPHLSVGRNPQPPQERWSSPTSTPAASNPDSLPRRTGLSSVNTPSSMSSKRQMELMPSISRSSGLDKNGDSLKNPKLQEEYRDFIEEKLEIVLMRCENLDCETEDEKKHRLEEQENVLILFRKLREGISSCGRIDDFSLEVYERSLYLSILFASSKHSTAIIPVLLNDVYQKAYSTLRPKNHSTTDHTLHRHLSLLISLINYLTVQYPSQSLYHQQVASIPYDWIPAPSRAWLKALGHALRSGNYHQFGILTNGDRVAQLIKLAGSSDESTATARSSLQFHNKLALHAFTTTVNALRTKIRAGTWKIVRSAFRELWFEEPFDTQRWLCRSLTFDLTEPLDEFHRWLSSAERAGEVSRREGAKGRWIVTKLQ